MKPLYTQHKYETSKLNDKLLCECHYCNVPFYATKKLINQEIHKKRNRSSVKFCSQKCFHNSNKTSILVNCKNCNLEFYKKPSQLKCSPNSFCSRSCAVTYNNKHKTHGNRRSKLEKYIEEQLVTLYSNIEIHFNKKDAINSELDIYIPSLNLAFELNGIFHYEPIYGQEKLSQIQNNDERKFQACIENNISLCIIDSSSLKHFTSNKANNFLKIITKIIDEKLKS